MTRNMAIGPSLTSARSPGLLGFSPLLDLNRDIARLFDELLQAPARAVPAELASTATPTIMTPQINLSETEGELRVTAELPGVDLDDLEVHVVDDILMIRGEKSIERRADDESFHLVERASGAFQRSVHLPFKPAADQVRASFENGVLTVVVPKGEQQQPKKRIEVHRGSAAQRQQQAKPQKEGNEEGKH
jgi:HSP20 family protein